MQPENTSISSIESWADATPSAHVPLLIDANTDPSVTRLMDAWMGSVLVVVLQNSTSTSSGASLRPES